MNNNNPMRLEFLIDSMKQHEKEVSKIIDQLEDDVHQLKKSNDKHIEEIQMYQPINPKAIKEHVDKATNSSLEVMNALKVHNILEQLDEYRQSIKELNNYYQNEYLKRVNGGK